MAEKLCTKVKNISKCNCTYEPCPRKGVCCECIDYHWLNSKELPACFFTAEAERTYDRSLEHFMTVAEKKYK